MRALLRWFLSDPTPTARDNPQSLEEMRYALVELERRMDQLEADETSREALLADQLQKLARVHKRMAQRFAMDDPEPIRPMSHHPDYETTLELRKRLGK